MSELGDILGDEFEEKYEEKRNSRQNASKVSTEVLMEIAYEAINNEGFKGEEPRFRFSGNSNSYDVLLMHSPEDDLETFRWPLGDEAKTQGMFHGDQLFSLAFQQNLLDLLDKIETDEYYLVVGQYEERTETNSNGQEDTYYNINPVQGIVPLSVGKKYADKYEDELQGSSVQEQAQKQQNESSTDDEPDIDMGDSGNSVTDDDVLQMFNAIGDQAPDLIRSVSEGNMLDKLVEVTNNNLDGETDREHILDVFEAEVDSIDGRGEDEDGGLDLGDLDGDDDAELDDGLPEHDGEDESDNTETEADNTDDEASDGDGDPSDWF